MWRIKGAFRATTSGFASVMRDSLPLKSKKPPTLAGGGLFRTLVSEFLLLDLIDATASLGLRRLDLEAVVLGGGREEAAHAVGLPGCRFHGID